VEMANLRNGDTDLPDAVPGVLMAALQRSRSVGSTCRTHGVKRIAVITAAGCRRPRKRTGFGGAAVDGVTRLARSHANGRCSSERISGSDPLPT
jgi:hypothetical protein